MTAHYLTGWTRHGRWINNVAYKCQTGFLIDKTSYSELRNNICYNCAPYNIEVTDSAYLIAAPTFSHNNCYTSTSYKTIHYRGQELIPTRFNTVVGDTAGLSANPRFVSLTDGQTDFTLQANSTSAGAGDRGVNLGAYAVYPRTAVGADSTKRYDQTFEVNFAAITDTATRGTTLCLRLCLNRANTVPVVVYLAPVAGNAIPMTDYECEDSIVIAAGETTGTFALKTTGYADCPVLLALRITATGNAQVGERSLMVITIPPRKQEETSIGTTRTESALLGASLYTIDSRFLTTLPADSDQTLKAQIGHLETGIYLLRLEYADHVEYRKIRRP